MCLIQNENIIIYVIYILFFLGTGSVTPLLQSYEKEQKYFIPGDQNDKADRIVSQRDIKNSGDTQIIKMEKIALPLTGAGRLLKLEQGMPLTEALAVIKDHLKLSHVRLAIANNATKGKENLAQEKIKYSGDPRYPESTQEIWASDDFFFHYARVPSLFHICHLSSFVS